MTCSVPSCLSRRQTLALCASWWLRPAAEAAPAAPPAVMLAREVHEAIDPAGWLVSEKLDGVRAVWDGRTLRFRSGLPISAPTWFIARLPATPLDGELWLGRGQFEVLSGAVRREVPVDAEWRSLRYQVFDQPGTPGPFAERAARLQALARGHGWAALGAVSQQRLDSRDALQRRLDEVVKAGGEGLMLHRANALWQPGRSDDLLKLKPLHDAEARVIGHIPGRGKHEGRLGALQVRTDDGTEFLIGTGFSDAERSSPPPLGAVMSFTHRGRTANGVPRFASYLRLRDGA